VQFWVYILRCADGSYYTGHTDRIESREGEHNAGLGSDWTRRRLPVQLVWCEVLPSRQEAYEAERRIKPWSRAKKEGLIARDWAQVSYFAKPPHERPSTSLGKSEGATRASTDARPSTSLGTSGEVSSDQDNARPERSAKRAVEGR
jgi:predicted GIY-YIG superfamily endonuclease